MKLAKKIGPIILILLCWTSFVVANEEVPIYRVLGKPVQIEMSAFKSKKMVELQIIVLSKANPKLGQILPIFAIEDNRNIEWHEIATQLEQSLNENTVPLTQIELLVSLMNFAGHQNTLVHLTSMLISLGLIDSPKSVDHSESSFGSVYPLLNSCEVALSVWTKNRNIQTFGSQLRILRKEKGLAQRGLAEELGVSQEAISRWERGSGRPSHKHLKEINTFFNKNLDDFL